MHLSCSLQSSTVAHCRNSPHCNSTRVRGRERTYCIHVRAHACTRYARNGKCRDSPRQSMVPSWESGQSTAAGIAKPRGRVCLALAENLARHPVAERRLNWEHRTGFMHRKIMPPRKAFDHRECRQSTDCRISFVIGRTTRVATEIGAKLLQRDEARRMPRIGKPKEPQRRFGMRFRDWHSGSDQLPREQSNQNALDQTRTPHRVDRIHRSAATAKSNNLGTENLVDVTIAVAPPEQGCIDSYGGNRFVSGDVHRVIHRILSVLPDSPAEHLERQSCAFQHAPAKSARSAGIESEEHAHADSFPVRMRNSIGSRT